MTCDRFDAESFLLAQGESVGRAAFALRAHLLVCARCRERVRQYRSLRQTLSHVYRNPVLGVRPMARATGWRSLPALAFAALLIGGMATFFVQSSRAASPAPVGAAGTSRARGCRDDLAASPIGDSIVLGHATVLTKTPAKIEKKGTLSTGCGDVRPTKPSASNLSPHHCD